MHPILNSARNLTPAMISGSDLSALDWSHMGAAMALVLVRISVLVALAPLFSPRAFPARAKVVFSLALCWLLMPVVAGVSSGVELSFSAMLGEVLVGAVYGLSLGLINEMLQIAGQIVGVQFSFSLVNLLDPASEIQTPLMADLFQILGTLVLFAAGLDRVLLASLVRSFRVVPPGSFPLAASTGVAHLLVPMLSGSFFAALELAAPVLAATVLVDLSVALLGKLSPQLPVIALTIPLKTMLGFVLLIGSLALWPRFIEARFSGLLDAAERMISLGGRG